MFKGPKFCQKDKKNPPSLFQNGRGRGHLVPCFPPHEPGPWFGGGLVSVRLDQVVLEVSSNLDVIL